MLYDSIILACKNFLYNVGCMLIVTSFVVFFTILGKIIIYIKVFVYAHAMISVNLGTSKLESHEHTNIIEKCCIYSQLSRESDVESHKNLAEKPLRPDKITSISV